MRQQVILASQSPRRKRLLKKIFRGFKVVPSAVNESRIKARTPVEFAVKAAYAKTADIAKTHKNSIIIGADTIVALGKKILGKPKDKKHAIMMLKMLSGKVQKVITGIAAYDPSNQKIKIDHEITRVKMKKLKEQDIINYVEKHNPVDKAGAYGIQELDELFIEKVTGDYDNVVGLPVKRLKKLLGL